MSKQDKGTPAQTPKPDVKKGYSRKAIKLAIFGALAVFSIAGVVIYILTLNMLIGAPAVLMAIVGGFGFHFAWKEDKELVVSYVGKTNKKQVNALILHPSEVVFEDFYIKEGKNDGGFIWTCDNDGKPYFILWENPTTKRIEPYTLPDQQYCDPEVFAQRYLELPCHRKILKRRESLLTKMRPVFLIIGIFAVWLLIITTTGQSEDKTAWLMMLASV